MLSAQGTQQMLPVTGDIFWWNDCVDVTAIPEDALNDESDNEDKENPDSRISSRCFWMCLYPDCVWSVTYLLKTVLVLMGRVVR